MSEHEGKLKVLEDFILNNPELDKLEGMLDHFNVFETLKMVHTEIRHSNVLSWLLNPSSNHGIGETFLKQFLKQFAVKNKEFIKDSTGLTLFDFEIFNYGNVEIRREWNNIDILIIVKEYEKNVVVAIENKIGSSEHSDQLRRYKRIVDEEFDKESSKHKKIFIYLTSEVEKPSDENWCNFTYDTVAEILDGLLTNKKDVMNETVYNFVGQYNLMLRRHIVGNSEVEEICKQIYKKHSAALDLIFQHKPDIYMEISDHMISLLKRDDTAFTVETTGKTYIRFSTPTIDAAIEKKGDKSWTSSARIVMFELINSDNKLSMALYIGPGDKEYREKLHAFFKQNDTTLFTLANRNLGRRWLALYKKDFLRKNDFENATIDDLKEKINVAWDEFVKTDLTEINKFISEFNVGQMMKEGEHQMKNAQETVFSGGAEGGGIALYRRLSHNGSHDFFTIINNSICFDENDADIGPIETERKFSSWNEAWKFLLEAEFYHMYPLEIHPDYKGFFEKYMLENKNDIQKVRGDHWEKDIFPLWVEKNKESRPT